MHPRFKNFAKVVKIKYHRWKYVYQNVAISNCIAVNSTFWNCNLWMIHRLNLNLFKTKCANAFMQLRGNKEKHKAFLCTLYPRSAFCQPSEFRRIYVQVKIYSVWNQFFAVFGSSGESLVSKLPLEVTDVCRFMLDSAMLFFLSRYFFIKRCKIIKRSEAKRQRNCNVKSFFFTGTFVCDRWLIKAMLFRQSKSAFSG